MDIQDIAVPAGPAERWYIRSLSLAVRFSVAPSADHKWKWKPCLCTDAPRRTQLALLLCDPNSIIKIYSLASYVLKISLCVGCKSLRHKATDRNRSYEQLQRLARILDNAAQRSRMPNRRHPHSTSNRQYCRACSIQLSHCFSDLTSFVAKTSPLSFPTCPPRNGRRSVAFREVQARQCAEYQLQVRTPQLNRRRKRSQSCYTAGRKY